MKELIIFIVTFILIYLAYYLFVIKRKKSLLKWKNGKEMTYLTKIYKLKIEDNNLKKIAKIIALDNSFIVALTLFIISFLKNFFIQLILGFVILCGLILLTYHIIGKHYQKKGMI